MATDSATHISDMATVSDLHGMGMDSDIRTGASRSMDTRGTATVTVSRGDSTRF